jgi:hypothetical protein
MSLRCRDCQDGLLHCHGALVHHVTLRAECTETDCESPEVAHAFSLDCVAIGCTCADSGAAAGGVAI